MSSGWQKERKNHLSPLPTCCQTREGKEKRNKCAHVDYRYVQNSFIQKLNKKTKYRNSVEGMYFIAQKHYYAFHFKADFACTCYCIKLFFHFFPDFEAACLYPYVKMNGSKRNQLECLSWCCFDVLLFWSSVHQVGLFLQSTYQILRNATSSACKLSGADRKKRNKQNFKNRCGNSPNICFYLYKTATFTFHGPAQTPQLASCWRWSEQNTFCHTQFFFSSFGLRGYPATASW